MVYMWAKPKQSGFTVVELLIVIVVIAILAAITTVAYSGIQARANDSRTRQGATQFAKSLHLYVTTYGATALTKGNSGSTTAISGLSCSEGGGSGFVGSGLYSCTTEDVLRAADYLPSGFTNSLPSNPYYGPSTSGVRSIMLYSCGYAPGSYALLWTLRQPSSDDTNDFNSLLSKCGLSPTSIRDAWGMRTGLFLQF